MFIYHIDINGDFTDSHPALRPYVTVQHIAEHEGREDGGPQQRPDHHGEHLLSPLKALRGHLEVRPIHYN